MLWSKTLKKSLLAALIMGASIAAIGMLDALIPELKQRPDVWAVLLMAAATALRDWLKHRGDPV